MLGMTKSLAANDEVFQVSMKARTIDDGEAEPFLWQEIPEECSDERSGVPIMELDEDQSSLVLFHFQSNMNPIALRQHLGL